MIIACGTNPATITRGDEQVRFTYDGTLPTSITQSGILNQTVTYAYNTDFLPQSITYAGATEPLAYNDDGELTRSGAFTLTRTHEGRRRILSDGRLRRVQRFNRYGELRQIRDSVLKVKLQRNKAGQIVKKIEKLKGTKRKVYTYRYDTLGRLIRVKKGSKTVERYTYDSNGNRKSARLRKPVTMTTAT